jgi:hypothetical protein
MKQILIRKLSNKYFSLFYSLLCEEKPTVGMFSMEPISLAKK